MKIELTPIGYVKSGGNSCSSIVVRKEFADALERVESFTHLVVIYWLNRVGEGDRNVVKVKPRFEDVPVLGVFATRFPARPNPIGITTVELVEKRGNTLIVRGLDAEDNTPVLDIKPYIPIYDKPKTKVRLPPWVKKHLRLHKRGEHPHTYEEILRWVDVFRKPS